MVKENKMTQENTPVGTPEHKKNSKDKKQKTSFNPEEMNSLSDYYKLEKLPATRFLSILKNNKITGFQENDIQHCLNILDETDSRFEKTLDLTYRAVNTKTPLGKQCISFASQACRIQLKNHYDINLDLSTSASAYAAFAEVFHALKSNLVDKNVDKRSFNLLKVILIWQSYSRNLSDIETLDLLATELVPNKGVRTTGFTTVFEILLKPATNIKMLRDMLCVTKNGLDKAEQARESEAREKKQKDAEFKRAQEYLEQLKIARAELDKKNDELSTLKSRLKNSEEEIEALKKRVENEKAISVHEKGDLKGRSRIFLTNKIEPLLETAFEFAELTPPRQNIILEKLDIAREEIRREVEWLKSTD